MTFRIVIGGLLLSGLMFSTAKAQSDQAISHPMASSMEQLRQLVTAQEKYFSDHGSYTTDLAALQMLDMTAVGKPDYIWLQVVHAGGRSWTGIAHPREHPDASCVVYVGMPSDFPTPLSTEKEKKLPSQEGSPVCDAP